MWHGPGRRFVVFVVTAVSVYPLSPGGGLGTGSITSVLFFSVSVSSSSIIIHEALMPSLLSPYWQTRDKESVRLYQGDALATLQRLPAEAVQCVVTSRPYWGLRDYGTAGQIGSEDTPQEFVSK